MLQIKVNGDKIIHTETNSNILFINQVPFLADTLNLSNNSFHIIKDNISYHAEILEYNLKRKKFKIKINNHLYFLEAKDKYDLTLEKLGLSDEKETKITDLKAPMPGLIVNILIKQGQEVKAGESLIVLEAMKMENVIKSPFTSIIKEVLIQIGNSVTKNQILIKF